MSRQRREIFFSGDVQGVGFRYTACRLAGGLSVDGYVRNLPDGRVEMVVEGAPDQIDRLLASLHDRLGGYIRQVRQQTSEPSGQYTGFSVRY